MSEQNEIAVKCPRCGSTNFSVTKKGISITQAIGGGIVFGPLGLLHGLTGKDDIILVCNACNKKWRPLSPDYTIWPEYEE